MRQTMSTWTPFGAMSHIWRASGWRASGRAIASAAREEAGTRRARDNIGEALDMRKCCNRFATWPCARRCVDLDER